jgi:hypothetical protein
MTIVKLKNFKWGGMHWCLPLLRKVRKLVFLSFMTVDPPKALDLAHLAQCRTRPRMECNA